MEGKEKYELERIAEYTWEVPRRGDMNVPGRLFVDEETATALLEEARSGAEWNALDQVINVASLPGIAKASFGLADIHPGYGFPIGGVGAFDVDAGVTVAGGVGFDINCGVRLMKTPLSTVEVEKSKEEIADALFETVPAGLGSEGRIDLSVEEINGILRKGARFPLERGYGFESDLEFIEERGTIEGANPENVSRRAKQRQFKQIGTLGSGNHYLEIQKVTEIYDREAARVYGLNEDQAVISIHTGSRALGHQIGQDYLKKLEEASEKYGLPIAEKELVSAPIGSPEGRKYLSAVRCGINCAFANRQAISGLIREALSETVGLDPVDVETVYEVGHNTAKFERHVVDGEKKELLVHRKGSTRAFGPNREELPARYRNVGGPLLVGGTMGTSSYVLRGSKKAMEETFGSGIHGAGRAMSRKKAKSKFWGEDVEKQLKGKGITVKSHSYPGLAEEAPGAYKDVEKVVAAASGSGLTPKVAKLEPLIVVKG
ncbi:MAG: RtcB family protein [Candidatus Bipolaricaulota bacterium]